MSNRLESGDKDVISKETDTGMINNARLSGYQDGLNAGVSSPYTTTQMYGREYGRLCLKKVPDVDTEAWYEESGKHKIIREPSGLSGLPTQWEVI